ncbi:Membrane protein mosC [Gulosibacter sp. 10]|nr:Membrane protein mosC [Gulosibacter sp. 10]
MVNGAMPATLLARYAEVKETFGLTTGAFGLVVVATTIGMAAVLHLPGVLLRRFGARAVTVLGTGGIALAFVLAAVGVLTLQLWVFVLGLLLAGFLDSTVDVAQNAQGLRVQEELGRSVLTSMHAGWSIGAAAGGAVGTLAATLGVPLVLHLLVWGAFLTATVAIAGTAFIPADRGEDEERPGRVPASAWRFLIPLSLVAIAGITVEDIGNNWSAVLLSGERGIEPASAGIGLTVLLAAQFAGRLLGDAVINAFGANRTIVASLIGILLGVGLVAWAPDAALTLVGFAIAGCSSAVTVPLAFAKADAVPGIREHTGVTLVAWTMRLGLIALTPSIAGLGDLFTLPIALSIIALVPFAALVLRLAMPDGDRAYTRSS